MSQPLRRFFPFFGLVGSALVCIVILIVGLTYYGQAAERFSPFNHFISELGHWGVSRNAWLFDAALIVSGILFVPFCIGLGIAVRGWWGYLGLGAGVLAGIFLAGVGVFPMNGLGTHIVMATWFFRFGLATTLFFGIAILRQRGRTDVPKSGSILSLFACATYALFLVLASIPGVAGGNPLDPATLAHRPGFWLLALLEWGVFLGTVVWFLGLSLLLTVRGSRGSETLPGRATGPGRSR